MSYTGLYRQILFQNLNVANFFRHTIPLAEVGTLFYKNIKCWHCYPQFSGKLFDRSESYWPQHIILDVYIQFYSKISTSPVQRIFFVYPYYTIRKICDFWSLASAPFLINCYPQFSGKLVILSTYYTGCVHSIFPEICAR